MPPVLTSRSRRLDSYHHSFTNSTPMPDGYSTLNNADEGTLLVTDEEDEVDTRHWPDETRSMAPSAGEDIVRTGEASRLRRRGAVHGRRRQFSYVSLICGAPLPWRFKFKDPHDVEPKRTSSLRSLNQRYEYLKSRPSSSNKDFALEFPSTGCRSTLTTRAYVSSSHQVYSASAPLQNVALVNKSYLDEEQKRTIMELLVDSWGHFDWQGLACSQCGNIIGFRYAPATFDEQSSLVDNCVGSSGYMPKERFAFFPSAITPSKPYDFTTQQHYSNSYYCRYLEPLSTTTINSYLRPSSRHGRQNQDLDSEDARPFQSHRPTSFSQGRSDTILDPQSSLSIRSISPSISSLDPIHHGAWGDPLSHVSRDTEQQLDDSWATWYPDPAYATDDDDEHIGEIELSEAISILRTTHGDIVPRLQLPLPPSLDRSQAIDHLVAIYASDDGDVFGADGTEASSDLLLRGQHAPNEPQVGDEHVPFGSNTPPVLIEEQTSSDNQHGYGYTQMNSTPDTILGQGQPLTLPDVHMLDDLHADGSQNHYESERVHDIMLQESDSTQVMQQGAEIEPTPEQVTMVQPNSMDIFTISSNPTLPIPLPIAYESPATVVDVESNERTGEMENVGILVEVAPPPPSSTSGFGSAVVFPSLVQQASTESSLRQLASEPPSSPIRPLEDLSSNVHDDSSDTIDNIPSDVNQDSDNIIILDELDADDEFPSHIASVPYQLYTPPLPLLMPQALAPSMPSSPSPRSSILTAEPFLSPASMESIQDESLLDNIAPDIPAPVDSHDIVGYGPVPENFKPATEPSVNMKENEISQPYLDEVMPSQHDLQNENGCFPMELRPSTLFESSSRSGFDTSPPRFVAATPTSQSQPLPAEPPTHSRDETIPALSLVSRRLSNYASATSSDYSAQRSSSRRSWRTPRESLESPQSAGSVDDDEADVSVSRRSSREFGSVSRGGADYGREARTSASRRVRGDSRIRRRRLSSSSRRESRISTSVSAFHTPPPDTTRFSGRSYISTSTSGIQFQQRIGDTFRRFPGLNASPELVRRGSLPSIDRPRLASLVRRDSLPVLSVIRREPLSDLTTTFHQRGFVSTAAQLPDPSSHPHRNHVSVGSHHGYERPSYELSNSRQNEYEVGHEYIQEERLVLEHENNPIIDDNDPEEALTPRPRRHTTMPVFIPTPPSDSDSETEDNAQNGERISYRRGSNLVPWMPWEWCWQDQRRIPFENGLQIEVQGTQVRSESDKEEE